MTLRCRAAELMGYKVVLYTPDGLYALMDPQGEIVTRSAEWPNFSEEEAWEFAPHFDEWAGVGLLLKWLVADQHLEINVSFNEGRPCVICTDDADILIENIEEFPKRLCEYALERYDYLLHKRS